ncbi:MarR family winged helix-turn-helix transcriptional regulator [Actinomycetospora termitidis]|uniref:MarR family transcriptional regulator n=1 Tax=Actinomycetospora termitidis TaxID=3053470 RepID=A0ABT7MD31_9PSEU|nr:MarR family transcriptional regulator [Actinomycetospora sp. Odt1-22]MDL5157757.1 MarR family transcriptional regulator [Actinomycetospora sp. Odt1-22]
MSQGSRTAARPRPSLLYAVKQVELIVRARLDELLRDSGVTALQYTALTVLAARDGLTSAELARNSFVTPQAMADLVTALERGDLITRRRNPDNRRQLLISLTPSGQDLLARYAEPVAAIEERMLTGLGDDERERFRSYLNAARASLAQ